MIFLRRLAGGLLKSGRYLVPRVYAEYTYKSLPGTIFKNRRLQVESEGNTIITGATETLPKELTHLFSASGA